MSAALAQITATFVRRTTLGENEYRVNFKQIDNDVIKALTSVEAREVTPQMATIYLTLIAAPHECWERAGVLHFVGEDREEGHLTAWEQMRKITGVANSTLSKALDWMRKTGVIGYDARANGVGIRVFINRAASSIREGVRQGREVEQNIRLVSGQGRGQGIDRTAQKNLRAIPTPSGDVHTPTDGARFKEHGVEKDSENYFPRAFARLESLPAKILSNAESVAELPSNSEATTRQHNDRWVDSELIATLTRRIASELRPEILTAVKRETDDAREWFLKFGLPKATRVAQRETYDLLRAQGVIAKKKATSDVGRYDETPEKGREGKREIDSVAVFLTQIGDALRRAATNFDAEDKRELQSVFHAVAGELDDMRRLARSGARPSSDEVENRLSALEEQVTKAMWRATDAGELSELFKAARNELTEYAERMETRAFEETVHRRVSAMLRDRYGAPRFNLFYA